MIHAEAGDVGFAHGTGWLQRAIRWAERAPGETPSWANHSLLFTRAGIVGTAPVAHQAWAVEALGRVEHNPWFDRHSNEAGYRVQVFRPLFVNYPGVVVANALAHKGDKYGWWKLGAFLGDRFFFKGLPFLAKLLFLDNRPICSYLVGSAFEEAGYPHAFGPVPARAQDPDTQHDYVTSGQGRWSYVGEVQVPA